METNNQNNGLDSLVIRLKKEDANYAKISNAIQIMYWIFIPFFAVMTTVEYIDTMKSQDLISGICLILAFLIFALFFRKYHKEYKNVDYSLPTLQMLKNAAYRYQPFQVRSIWILIALLLIDAGLTIDWLNMDMSLLDIQLTFGGLILVAIILGLILWYIRYKPLRDDTLKLIREIEG